MYTLVSRYDTRAHVHITPLKKFMHIPNTEAVSENVLAKLTYANFTNGRVGI